MAQVGRRSTAPIYFWFGMAWLLLGALRLVFFLANSDRRVIDAWFGVGWLVLGSGLFRAVGALSARPDFAVGQRPLMADRASLSALTSADRASPSALSRRIRVLTALRQWCATPVGLDIWEQSLRGGRLPRRGAYKQPSVWRRQLPALNVGVGWDFDLVPIVEREAHQSRPSRPRGLEWSTGVV